MTLKSRMQEFGFLDIDRFPRDLHDHAVTLSLPSAMEHGVKPVEIEIKRGLAIPAQILGSANGIIIRHDGMILHVGHSDPKDPASSLEAKFIKDIPYDLRVEISNIMRRAVLADPSLGNIWNGIVKAWKAWFPMTGIMPGSKHVGRFPDAARAWYALCQVAEQLIDKLLQQRSSVEGVGIKVVVQNESEVRQGWLGEELTVDERALSAIIKEGRIKYLRQHLFLKMRQVLENPVFDPRSTFMLFYEPRSAHTIKLVVVPPPERAASLDSSFGIRLDIPQI